MYVLCGNLTIFIRRGLKNVPPHTAKKKTMAYVVAYELRPECF